MAYQCARPVPLVGKYSSADAGLWNGGADALPIAPNESRYELGRAVQRVNPLIPRIANDFFGVSWVSGEMGGGALVGVTV